MPDGARSKFLARAEAEQQIQAALEQVISSGLDKHGKPILSLCAAAEQHGVSKTTLTARYNGRKTRTQAHEHQQRLSVAQEDWVKALGRRAVPMPLATLAEYGSMIAGSPLSESWARHFRARHGDLKARWTTGLECC
jgi:hypothetical protein